MEAKRGLPNRGSLTCIRWAGGFLFVLVQVLFCYNSYHVSYDSDNVLAHVPSRPHESWPTNAAVPRRPSNGNGIVTSQTSASIVTSQTPVPELHISARAQSVKRSLPEFGNLGTTQPISSADLEERVNVSSLYHLDDDKEVLQWEAMWCAKRIQYTDICTAYPTLGKIQELGSKKQHPDDEGAPERMMMDKTQIFKVGKMGKISSFDVTLVSQTTFDAHRNRAMNRICDRWEGAISMIVFIKGVTWGEADVEFPTEADIRKTFPKCTSTANKDREVTLIVMQAKFLSPFPINRLRNLAISQVFTSHYFFTDVDFLPSKGLQQIIHGYESDFLADPKLAVVVPAFQYLHECEDSDAGRSLCAKDMEKVPYTLKELISCQKKCVPFDSKNAGGVGHGTTNYAEWWKQKQGVTDSLRKIPCLQSTRYEPFFVVRKGGYTPRYNEDFMGYGKNKVQFTRHLVQAGFRLSVLPQGFVIHAPHVKSEYFQKWNNLRGCKKGRWCKQDPMRQGNDHLFAAMEEEMGKHYLGINQLPMCE